MEREAPVDPRVVDVADVAIRYGRNAVMSGVSFAVTRGAVYTLLGRNGAGKSSLVRCILGQQPASSGMARLFGGDSWKTRRQAMRRVGVVPEAPDAPPEMNAHQLAAFCARLYPRWDSVAVRARLEHFEVPVDLRFEQLSKGQKGAVMLALALGHAPELLVLDDPTLGLDVIARHGFYDGLLLELAERGTTVFMTTHDLAGIEAVATRVGILAHGRLVIDEDLEALKARFRRVRCPLDQASTAGDWAPFTPAVIETGGFGVSAVVSNYTESAWEKFVAERSGQAEAEPLSLEEIFAAVDTNAEGEKR